MGERRNTVVSVVDDDASLRRSVRNLLMSAGFTVQAEVRGTLADAFGVYADPATPVAVRDVPIRR